MTVSAKQCLAKFGDPTTEKHMVLYDVPTEMELGAIPKRVYCNKLLRPLLHQAFRNIIDRGLVDEVKTWDGCFHIRKQRGSLLSMSLHSWGLAVDLNASWNKLGNKPTMSPALVKCFTDAGFEWGGNWKRPDGMHFQIASLPA